ncbi:MAG: hypothetical protein JSR82_21045 [Verrucomicrobia bacterium]|nr:hypothetical protein [Verrucomicrobiota bacterium]
MSRHLYETNGWMIFAVLIVLALSLGVFLRWRGVPRPACLQAVYTAAGVYFTLLLLTQRLIDLEWRYSEGILPYLIPVPPMALGIWWLLRRRAREGYFELRRF